jgi:uncharacterized protein
MPNLFRAFFLAQEIRSVFEPYNKVMSPYGLGPSQQPSFAPNPPPQQQPNGPFTPNQPPPHEQHDVVPPTPRPKPHVLGFLKPSTRHRLQFAAAILGTIGAVYGFSRLIKPHRPEPPKPAPIATFIPAPTIIPRFDPPIVKPETPPPPRVNPAFMAAVGEGDIASMEKSYTEGMPLDGTLAVAVGANNKAVTAWLLDHNANVHENESGTEALLILADEHSDMVKLLLDKGAGEPDLQLAANAGALNAVTRILAKNKGAAKEISVADFFTSAGNASEKPEKRRVILEKLIAAGAVLNPQDGQSLMSAVVGTCEMPDEEDANGNVKKPAPPIACLGMIQFVGSKGAKTGSDALVTATSFVEPMRTKVIDALLAQRLEADATTNAIGSVSGENAVIIKKLAGHGVVWNFHDGEADAVAPLLDAIERLDSIAVKAMLDAGAPADMHFKDGRSPLGLAIEKVPSDNGEAARMIDMLLARGANVNRRLPDGRTPLFAAAETGDIRVINAMLDRGSRVNEVVLDQTALDAAESNGHVPAARVLHARGGRRARPADSEIKVPGAKPKDTDY